MWGSRATTVSVIIGALGLTKKGKEKYNNMMIMRSSEKKNFKRLSSIEMHT